MAKKVKKRAKKEVTNEMLGQRIDVVVHSVDDLARTVASGFAETATKIERLDVKIDGVEQRLSVRIDNLDMKISAYVSNWEENFSGLRKWRIGSAHS